MTKVMVSLMPMGPGQEEKHIPLAVPVEAPSDEASFEANRDAAYKAASWVFEHTNTNAAWPHRSLSVGDIVQVKLQDKRIMMVACCTMGWVVLARTQLSLLRSFSTWAPETPLHVRAALVDAAQAAERMNDAAVPADLMSN